MNSGLTYEIASRLLQADFETGKLYWRERTPDLFEDGNQGADRNCANWNSRYAGKEAFATANGQGYRKGGIFGSRYKAHRVIWLLAHGEWPTEQIDHINGDRADNRPINLRQVSNTENQKNAKRPRNNTSGVVGVYWNKPLQKWMAYIVVNRRQINLGYFDAFEDAVAGRRAAEVKYGFHVNHGRAA